MLKRKHIRNCAIALGILGLGGTGTRADSLLAGYPIGVVVSGAVKMPHVTVPMPAGPWTVISKTESSNNNSHTVGTLYLAQILSGMEALPLRKLLRVAAAQPDLFHRSTAGETQCASPLMAAQITMTRVGAVQWGRSPGRIIGEIQCVAECDANRQRIVFLPVPGTPVAKGDALKVLNKTPQRAEHVGASCHGDTDGGGAIRPAAIVPRRPDGSRR